MSLIIIVNKYMVIINVMNGSKFFFLNYLFIYIYGCVGSSFPCEGFL